VNGLQAQPPYSAQEKRQTMRKRSTSGVALVLVWSVFCSAAGAVASARHRDHSPAPTGPGALKPNTINNDKAADTLPISNAPAADTQVLLQSSKSALHLFPFPLASHGEATNKIHDEEEKDQREYQDDADADSGPEETARFQASPSSSSGEKERRQQQIQIDPRGLQSKDGEDRPQDPVDRANGGLSIIIPEADMKKRTDLKDQSHLFEKVDNANIASAKLASKPHDKPHRIKRRKRRAGAISKDMSFNEDTSSKESEGDDEPDA